VVVKVAVCDGLGLGVRVGVLVAAGVHAVNPISRQIVTDPSESLLILFPPSSQLIRQYNSNEFQSIEKSAHRFE